MFREPTFEQGPIRPPSEAGSLLVRVSRNCPWNRCAFCPVYKNLRFSLRPVEEVLQDLDAMQAFYGERPTTVFLQDANPLLTRTDDLVRILEGIRQRFPRVVRITAYARSHTLARRSVSELRRIREAGLNRLHVGMESGCDAVLQLVEKGTSRADQIEGGRRAKEAGFELSEYFMPGLGGKELSDANADDSATALLAIKPDFVRLRTTAVSPGTGLADLVIQGKMTPLSEKEMVVEIQRFLSGLVDLSTQLESDHVLNLLMELRGDLPADLPRLLNICDEFLQLQQIEQNRFILGRRLGWFVRLNDRNKPRFTMELDNLISKIAKEGSTVEDLCAQLRAQTL
jgi:histone acetyltransferase (RNA polymerase elongator complex component)